MKIETRYLAIVITLSPKEAIYGGGVYVTEEAAQARARDVANVISSSSCEGRAVTVTNSGHLLPVMVGDRLFCCLSMTRETYGGLQVKASPLFYSMRLAEDYRSDVNKYSNCSRIVSVRW